MAEARVNDRLWVAGQPDIQQFADLAARGFSSVINARLDGETPGQPGSDKERSAAKAAGLAYSFVPVTSAGITQADIRAFQSAVARATAPSSPTARAAPARSRCMSSARCWTAGCRRRRRLRSALGFDLKGAERWLAARATGQAPHVKGFFDPRTSSIQYVVATRRRSAARSSIRCSTSTRSPARPPRPTPTPSSPMSTSEA